MDAILKNEPAPPPAFMAEDFALEFAKLQREAIANVAARMAREQCGEAFEGLDTNRRSS